MSSKHLITPCLLGYNIINKHDELQWSLYWNPRPSDIELNGNMDITKNSPEYDAYADCASMFDLTQDNIIHIDNINNNNTLNPNGHLRILRRKKECFISAFAINYKKGSLIIAPAHCRDNIVELFDSKEDIHFSSTIAPTEREESAAGKNTIQITDWPKLNDEDNTSYNHVEITIKTPFSKNKKAGHIILLHHFLKFLIIYQLTEDDTPLLYCTKEKFEELDSNYPGKYKCLMTAKKGLDRQLNNFDFLDFFIKGGKVPKRGIKLLKRCCSHVLTGEPESDKVKEICTQEFINFTPKNITSEPYKKFSIINCDIKLADGFIEFCKKIDFEKFNSDLIITFLEKLALNLKQKK